MIDIVERLRLHHFPHHATAQEAADEIERLRAALKLAVFYATNDKIPVGAALDVIRASLETSDSEK